MSSVMASIAAMVHPHQIEVQDFDVYDLIIDARSEAEYAQDCIPGALNLPRHARPTLPASGIEGVQGALSVREVVSCDSYANGSLPAVTASGFSSKGSPVSFGDEQRLRRLVRGLQPGAFLLVYCSRGGLDSMVWATLLRHMGFEVDVLGGGWTNYQRWVSAGLETLVGHLSLSFVQEAPMGGLEELFARMRARGQQVLHLDWIASEASVPGCAWPSERSVHPSRFDSLLLDALRRVDAQRPVWLGRCWHLPLRLRLPAAMERAMERGPWVRLLMAADQRARSWQRWLEDQAREGVSLRQSIAALARRVASVPAGSASAPPLSIETAQVACASQAETAVRLAALLGDAVARTPPTAQVLEVTLTGIDEGSLDLAADQCISASMRAASTG